MKKLLTFRDLLDLLAISEATLRRRIAETRAGTGTFPMHVNFNGSKRKLLWNPADIERWVGCQQQTTPTLEIESASSRTQRHAAAMKSLARKGVNIRSTKEGGQS